MAGWRAGGRARASPRPRAATGSPSCTPTCPALVGSRAAGAARRTGVPLAVTCHVLDATGQLPAGRPAGAEARRVIAVSEHLQEALGRPGGSSRRGCAWCRPGSTPRSTDPERVRGHRVLGLAERWWPR
ncbi:MAG: hypothetical protein U1E17_02900 [Geminicoccaceae bacterium]